MKIVHPCFNPLSTMDWLLVDQVYQHYCSRLLANPNALDFLAHHDIDLVALQAQQCGFSDRTLGFQLPRDDTIQHELVRGQLQRLGLLKASGHELFCGCIVIGSRNEHCQLTKLYGRRIAKRIKHTSEREILWLVESGSKTVLLPSDKNIPESLLPLLGESDVWKKEAYISQ